MLSLVMLLIKKLIVINCGVLSCHWGEVSFLLGDMWEKSNHGREMRCLALHTENEFGVH